MVLHQAEGSRALVVRTSVSLPPAFRSATLSHLWKMGGKVMAMVIEIDIKLISDGKMYFFEEIPDSEMQARARTGAYCPVDLTMWSLIVLCHCLSHVQEAEDRC